MTMKNNLADYTVNNDKIWGIFRGVVEDRKDPELLGRCRVRVFGIHDEPKVKDPLNGIPTDELPWAHPCFGLFEGSVSGNGEWSVPLQGSHVFVFFENGNWMQPRFFLSAPGQPEEPANPELGFNDPAGEWPDPDWLKESDLHRLMKKDLLPKTSLLEVKVPMRVFGVPIAIGGEWEEYWPMYQAEYPFNTVKHGHGGVYTELDNTEGKTRWHVYHPSNSYIEIGERGNMTIRNALSRYDIVDENRFEHTMMTHHRCVGEDRTSRVLSNEWEQIDFNHYRAIGLNDNQTINVNRWTDIGMSDSCYVGSNRNIQVGSHNLVYSISNDTHYTGAVRTEWNDIGRKKVTEINEYERIGLNKIKHVAMDELNIVDNKKKSWVEIFDVIEAGETIHLKAGVNIILEAPDIEFRADTFKDLAAKTEIAGDLSWNGIAMGNAMWSMFSNKARSLGGAVATEAIAAVAPEAPEPPIRPSKPPKPKKPAPPPSIPAPPAPPIPPVLEYVDVPPEPDVCE